MNVRRPSSPFHRMPPPSPPRGRGYDYDPEPEPEPEPPKAPSPFDQITQICREFNEKRANSFADAEARRLAGNEAFKRFFQFPPKHALGWIAYLGIAATLVFWTYMICTMPR